MVKKRTTCKINISGGNCCGIGSNVLVTHPAGEYTDFNVEKINIQIGGEEIRPPLRICDRCIERLKEDPNIVSGERLLGYVHVQIYYSYKFFKDYNKVLQDEGYVVFSAKEFSTVLKRLRINLMDIYLKDFLDIVSCMKSTKLFTRKTPDVGASIEEESFRQW